MRRRSRRTGRRRLVPAALGTAVLCSTVLTASVTGTLSAFAASITDAASTASAGQLVLSEQDDDGAELCSSSSSADDHASCTDPDAYGGTADGLQPGDSTETVLRFQDTGGTDAAAFTLAPGACSSSGAGDLCASLDLTLTCWSDDSMRPVRPVGPMPVESRRRPIAATVYSDETLEDVAADGPQDLPADCVPEADGADSVSFDVVLQMDRGAPDSVQGETVAQSLEWTLTSG